MESLGQVGESRLKGDRVPHPPTLQEVRKSMQSQPKAVIALLGLTSGN